MNLKNKKVLVVGLGISGLGASRLLLDKGALVWVTEKEDNAQLQSIANDLTKQSAVVELGKHTEDFIKGKDLVVVSPGVTSDCEVIKWADNYKIPVISELELASRFVKCPMVCVTGTNGKSTVTSLIDHIFRHAGRNSIACGNLGMSFSEVILKYKNLDCAVVEVSSFQLEYIKDFRPTVSVWLNFSYDHLDHHLSMEDYLKAKLGIFENQTEEDWAVIYYKEVERVGKLKAKKLIYGKKDNLKWLKDDVLLKGKHNKENILAAVAVTKIFGIKEETILDAVRTFRPLPHRMEHVVNIDGIDFIDDSKATNVHAVISALEGLSGPIILILGGRDKGDNFTRLRKLIEEKVNRIIVLGEAKEKIMSQLSPVSPAIGGTNGVNEIVPIHEVMTIDDAVDCAYSNASTGSTILLSPGCSSFDMFKDYKERGERFKEAIFKLNLKLKTQKAKLRMGLCSIP